MRDIRDVVNAYCGLWIGSAVLPACVDKILTGESQGSRTVKAMHVTLALPAKLSERCRADFEQGLNTLIAKWISNRLCPCRNGVHSAYSAHTQRIPRKADAMPPALLPVPPPFDGQWRFCVWDGTPLGRYWRHCPRCGCRLHGKTFPTVFVNGISDISEDDDDSRSESNCDEPRGKRSVPRTRRRNIRSRPYRKRQKQDSN